MKAVLTAPKKWVTKVCRKAMDEFNKPNEARRRVTYERVARGFPGASIGIAKRRRRRARQRATRVCMKER